MSGVWVVSQDSGKRNALLYVSLVDFFTQARVSRVVIYFQIE